MDYEIKESGLVVTEWALVCGNSWLKTLALAKMLFFTGFAIGSFFVLLWDGVLACTDGYIEGNRLVRQVSEAFIIVFLKISDHHFQIEGVLNYQLCIYNLPCFRFSRSATPYAVMSV